VNLEKFSAAQKCYSCTNTNPANVWHRFKDSQWKKWLLSIRSLTTTDRCLYPDGGESSSLTTLCANGTCTKLVIHDFGSNEMPVAIWRTCIPRGKNRIRPGCLRLNGEDANIILCTCNDDLCNSSLTVRQNCRFLVCSLYIISVYFIYTS
ncbi:unnamed protein product, partial [Soboliphyme baturini]|uniref:Activin_recp domain-containing protein n=1 Tax=Soboliphyme baturini TaxID=241478 RepID=A0A183IK89_9BILA